jgi:hypothetical protein
MMIKYAQRGNIRKVKEALNNEPDKKEIHKALVAAMNAGHHRAVRLILKSHAWTGNMDKVSNALMDSIDAEDMRVVKEVVPHILSKDLAAVLLATEPTDAAHKLIAKELDKRHSAEMHATNILKFVTAEPGVI